MSAQINDVGVVKVPLLVKDGAFQLDTVNVIGILIHRFLMLLEKILKLKL